MCLNSDHVLGRITPEELSKNLYDFSNNTRICENIKECWEDGDGNGFNNCHLERQCENIIGNCLGIDNSKALTCKDNKVILAIIPCLLAALILLGQLFLK